MCEAVFPFAPNPRACKAVRYQYHGQHGLEILDHRGARAAIFYGCEELEGAEAISPSIAAWLAALSECDELVAVR